MHLPHPLHRAARAGGHPGSPPVRSQVAVADPRAHEAPALAAIATSMSDLLTPPSSDLAGWLAERRVGHDPATIAQALADLRGHITTAAHTVRALPDHVQVRNETGEALAFAVRRCLVRYAGTLEVELTWSGGEASSTESASALLWVLQEVLHHLHQV